MEEIVVTAGSGLTALQQFGLAGILLSILLAFGALCIWYLAFHCEKRTEATLEAYKEEARTNRDVVAKNTEAYHDMRIALTELRGRLKE